MKICIPKVLSIWKGFLLYQHSIDWNILAPFTNKQTKNDMIEFIKVTSWITLPGASSPCKNLSLFFTQIELILFGTSYFKGVSLFESPFSISLIALHLIAKGFTFNLFVLASYSASYLVTAWTTFLKFQTDNSI